jgi:exonuclease VII large subunit
MKLLWLFLLLAAPAAADCIPIEEAPNHVGEVTCVTGKVKQVKETESGTWFLNFCDDYRQCPFSVVVFAKDLRHVGEVRTLEGKAIEIHGRIQNYKGRPEIVLREARQLRGEAANIPPLPAAYDAGRKGTHSAGTFKPKKGDPPRQTQRRPRGIKPTPEAGSESGEDEHKDPKP